MGYVFPLYHATQIRLVSAACNKNPILLQVFVSQEWNTGHSAWFFGAYTAVICYCRGGWNTWMKYPRLVFMKACSMNRKKKKNPPHSIWSNTWWICPAAVTTVYRWMRWELIWWNSYHVFSQPPDNTVRWNIQAPTRPSRASCLPPFSIPVPRQQLHRNRCSDASMEKETQVLNN